MTEVIVPKRSGVVKKAMDQLLEGYAVKGDFLGVEEVGEMTPFEICQMMHELLKAGRTAVTSVRFRMGDIYNHLGNVSKGNRRKAMKQIAKEFSENDRQMFRTCGWVAKKWPRADRNDTDGWTYFLRKNPGDPRMDQKKVPEYTGVDVKDRTSWFEVRCEDKFGRPILAVIPKRLFEDTGHGLTYSERPAGYGAECLHEEAAA